MDQTSTPRITCPYLNNYVGKNVMIVGKVLQLRGDMATLDADGNVTAHLNRVCSVRTGGRHILSLAHMAKTVGSAPLQRQRGSDHRQGEPRPLSQSAQRLGSGRRRGFVSTT